MPRYFFHVHDGKDIPDLDGTELKGPDEARAAAVTALGEALKDLGGEFWTHPGEWRMQVTDEVSAVLCLLRVSGE